MSHYIKFWLAKNLVELAIGFIAIAIFLAYALWGRRRQKFYKESKAQRNAPKE